MGGLAMPAGQAAETVRPQPRPEGLVPQARPAPTAEDAILNPSQYYRTKILKQESGYRQFDENGKPLTSPAGAVGIAQVMEGTGPEAARLAGVPWDRDRWLNDAQYNAQIGEAYFLDQYRKFGDLGLASAAYNAGPGAVSKAMRRAERRGGSYLDYLPEETQNYVLSTRGAAPGEYQGGADQSGLGRAILRPDKPYEDRNTLGKMFYNEKDGTLNKNALLSLASGVGGMLSSPSQFFLPSLGLGLQGFAGTYAGLEKQAADIGLTKAEEARSRVSADVESFFTSNKGADGYPMVRVGPGRIVSLTDYLKNPTIFSTGDPSRDKLIMEEAQRISSSGAPLDTAAPVAAPSNVRWTDASSEAISRAETYGGANPMNFGTNNRIAQEMVVGANEAASSAAEAKPNSNELAYTVGNAIAENNMGNVEGWTAENVIAPVNAVLRTLGVPEISNADTEATILSKLGTLNSKSLTPEEQRAASVFQQFVEVSPNLRMTPEAASAITSSLMLANQQDIDKANYYGYFQSQADAGFAPGEMSKGYASEYSALHQIEKQNLTDLFLAASDPERGAVVKNFLAGVNAGTATQEEAQAVLAYILGAENVSPGLARYFIRGM
jgi:hypothetical protein